MKNAIWLEFLKLKNQKLIYYLLFLVVLVPVCYGFSLGEYFKTTYFYRWREGAGCSDFWVYYFQRFLRMNILPFGVVIFALVFQILKIDQNPKGVSLMQIIPIPQKTIILSKLFVIFIILFVYIFFYTNIFLLLSFYLKNKLNLEINVSYIYFLMLGLHLFLSCVIYAIFCFVICVIFGKSVYFLFAFSILISFFGFPLVPSSLFLSIKITQNFYFPVDYLFFGVVIVVIFSWILAQKRISFFRIGF